VGVGSRFHVMRAQTRFQLYGRASGPVFMLCAPGHVFGGAEGVESRFHVLRSRTHFRQYRGHRVSFSRFARPESFSAVLRVSAPIFMFCAPGLIFGVTEGVKSYFHVLHSRSHFRRHREERVPFSSFALPVSFSAVPGATCPIFMFCAPRLVFDGTEGVGSRFHVLRTLTHFRRYRERWVRFSCFVLQESFSAVPMA
jgi:hypothetical protein